jgi:hypothetical protein
VGLSRGIGDADVNDPLDAGSFAVDGLRILHSAAVAFLSNGPSRY